MTENDLHQFMLLGIVSKMPADDQQGIASAKAELTAVVEKFGDKGAIAFALLGFELQAAL